MPGESEAERDDDRPQHATRGRMHDPGAQHQREARPERDDQRARADCQDGDRRKDTRRAHRINQRATGHLRKERDQPACSQDEPDVELGPRMRGEVDRNEGTKAGLDVRQEESEPVEAARTCARSRVLRVGRWRRRCKRARDAKVETTARYLQR